MELASEYSPSGQCAPYESESLKLEPDWSGQMIASLGLGMKIMTETIKYRIVVGELIEMRSDLVSRLMTVRYRSVVSSPYHDPTTQRGPTEQETGLDKFCLNQCNVSIIYSQGGVNSHTLVSAKTSQTSTKILPFL